MKFRARWPIFGLPLTSLVMASAGAHAAPALPSGGSVVSGAVGIASSGSALTVSQTSGKAIIDWSSFSIGQGGSVMFKNGSGATLNRVTGTGSSTIDGVLSATGSVYLINAKGVIVGKSGVVNTGGSFVASTLDIANGAFLKGGDLTFTGPSTAAVVNLGKVGSLGGDVVLVAHTVGNAGTLSASNGTVGLVAGQSVLLRDQALDDGKFSVLVGGAFTSATNSGSILAANAELRAEGGNVYALAGDTTGIIRATGVKQGDGKVWLVAEGGGTTTVAGEISAKGADGAGGFIETSAGRLNLGKAEIDAGAGGAWLLDPYDLTIDQTAANTISAALNNNTNVTEQTTASGAGVYGVQNASGSGDIIVNAPISWSTGSTFTLDAYHSININAPITANAGSRIVLTTNDGGTGGALGFGLSDAGFAGSVNFTAPGAGPSLIVNGVNYTLLYTAADLSSLSGGGETAALANNLALSTAYTTSPIDSFNGVLEGLGHTVSGLNITSTGGRVGLIGTLETGATVSDIGVTGEVSAANTFGGLVGLNQGTIGNAYSAVTVNGGSGAYSLGGLVGDNDGGLTGSFATGAVTGGASAYFIGGLVGYNDSALSGSHAEGAVGGGDNASNLGGLVGYSAAPISGAYATGAVTGGMSTQDIGGLIGQNISTISGAYATGAVSGESSSSFVGGLVGYNNGGVVSQSYATGTVGGAGEVGGLVGGNNKTLDHDYATGAVTASGDEVGGLVGYNYDIHYGDSSITQSYASGAVYSTGQTVGGLVGYGPGGLYTQVYATGSVAGAAYVGGLVGFFAGTLSQDYASGEVSASGGGSGNDIGALVGYNNGASFSYSYWDKSTSGQSTGFGAGHESDATGLTTAQFMNAAKFTGFTFTTTPGGAGWVIVDTDGTLNGTHGATRPILASEYSTTIINAHQLQLMALNTAATYTLGSSVDASGTSNPSDVWGGTAAGGFVPLGSAAAPFTGTFNGVNAAIFDLTINRPALKDVGLFGVLGSSGQAINFSLNDPTISGQNYVGAIAGYNKGEVGDDIIYGGSVTAVESGGGLVGYNTGSISTSTVTDNVSGDYHIGGLVGQNSATGTVFRVLSTGQTVTGVTDVGGLVGVNQGTVDGSNIASTNATVIATGDYAGGFIGYNTGSVTDGTSAGSVSGLNYVGGLIGYSTTGTISGGTSSASVTSARSYVGGLVGDLVSGQVSGSSASGKVQASGNNVGGLVGQVGQVNGGDHGSYYYTAIVYASSATGQVSGQLHVGGLVGFNNGTGLIYGITADTDPQTVQGLSDVGGLVGENLGSIGFQRQARNAKTASNATVTATGNYAGGLVGYNYYGAEIFNATSEGSVKGAKDVGGIAGRNDGSVVEANTSVDVTANDIAGGLIGYNTGFVDSSTATGTVTATGKHKGPCYGVNTNSQGANPCD